MIQYIESYKKRGRVKNDFEIVSNYYWIVKT